MATIITLDKQFSMGAVLVTVWRHPQDGPQITLTRRRLAGHDNALFTREDLLKLQLLAQDAWEYLGKT